MSPVIWVSHGARIASSFGIAREKSHIPGSKPELTGDEDRNWLADISVQRSAEWRIVLAMSSDTTVTLETPPTPEHDRGIAAIVKPADGPPQVVIQLNPTSTTEATPATPDSTRDAIVKGCGSSGGTSGGSGNGAVEVAGFVDAVSFSVEVPGPVCLEVAVAAECS